MASERIRSVLRGLDFKPLKVVAGTIKEKDKWGRQLFRPIVEATLGGTLCKIVPMDVGVTVSPGEAVDLGEKWAELV